MGVIRFPNLGFEVNVGNGISIFGFEIAYYGMIIATGMICGALIAYYEAKRTGQNVDNYIDYTLIGIISAILGARIYYVIFQWSYYSENLDQIINLRGGGLAIYGGVIAAIFALYIFTKIKKLNFLKLTDTMIFGLILGQIIGRWGNFFNREAYGGFTNGLFAMQIPVEDASVVNNALTVMVDGVQYVQVHPTFLYESFLNLILLIILLIIRDKRKFYGENLCYYFIGYGIIRFFVEGMRTDQLQLFGVAVSQVLSIVLFFIGLTIVVIMRIRLKGKPSKLDHLQPGFSKEPENTVVENDAKENKQD